MGHYKPVPGAPGVDRYVHEQRHTYVVDLDGQEVATHGSSPLDAAIRLTVSGLVGRADPGDLRYVGMRPW
jgi:hypothetical protein